MIAPPSPAVLPARPEAAATSDPGTGSPEPVLGDGTTLSSRSERRWRSARGPLLGLGIILTLAVVVALLTPNTSETALAPDSPQPDGARAVAQVLERQGVTVYYTRSRTEVLERAASGATVAVFNSQILPEDLVQQLTDSGADLALFEPSADMLVAASEGGLEPARAGSIGATSRPAQCTDAVGRDVEVITSSGANYRLTEPANESAIVCFPAPESSDGSGSYARLQRADGAWVDVVDDHSIVTNEAIVKDGNAALALRMLGQHDTLVWYLPDPKDLTAQDNTPPGLLATMPGQTLPVALLAGFVIVALMFARGRRLGPVVTEPLPVLVQAAEVTRGRGRLYRRARSYGHAAAALRAGAADRLATRVGLPRSATAPELIDALARATNQSDQHIGALLYGPPPTTDTEFVRLTAALDKLENEVYHP